MRIISGKYKGRRLATVPEGVRPTIDRVRESLFNVLRDVVADSVWLDLFAGSGAVGIEALSRGARYVIFNDSNPKAVKALAKNLEICGITDGYEIHSQDIFVLLKTLKSPPLDFVFLDPPYAFHRHDKLLDRVGKLPSIQPHTTIILEVFKKTKLEKVPETLNVTRTLPQGDNQLFFLRPQSYLASARVAGREE